MQRSLAHYGPPPLVSEESVITIRRTHLDHRLHDHLVVFPAFVESWRSHYCVSWLVVVIVIVIVVDYIVVVVMVDVVVVVIITTTHTTTPPPPRLDVAPTRLAQRPVSRPRTLPPRVR